MEWVIFLVIVASIYGAYKLGEKEGVQSVNREQIDVGTWIEVVKPVNFEPSKERKQNKVPIGTQGIVTGKDKWNRIHIWVAYPWSKDWDHPQLYQIKEYEKLRIKPESRVSNEVKKPTLEALKKWQDFKEESYKIIFGSK